MKALIEYFRPPPLRTLADLETFVSGEAAYLAQRSTYEFSRNTLAWYGQAAFADPEFNDAFRICRWEAFAAVLAGFVVLVRLRLGAGPVTDGRLVELARRVLAAYPTPIHRPDWQDILDALAARLADLDGKAPPTPTSLGAIAAEAVYPTLPVRSGNRQEDRAVIANALSFGTIAFNDRLVARLDLPAMRAALTAERGA